MIEALNLVPDFLKDLVSDNLLDALSRGVIRMEPLCQIALERSIPEVTDIRAAIRFTCRVTRSAASAGSRSYWLLNHNVPTRDVARFAQSLAERRDPLGQIQASCGRSRPAAVARSIATTKSASIRMSCASVHPPCSSSPGCDGVRLPARYG